MHMVMFLLQIQAQLFSNTHCYLSVEIFASYHLKIIYFTSFSADYSQLTKQKVSCETFELAVFIVSATLSFFSGR